jgi:hypothetical protein
MRSWELISSISIWASLALSDGAEYWLGVES